MPNTLLQVKGVSKFFGGLTALNKVDFEINAGEVVALLGDNGAGKSTLIKCISGVYKPEEGEILFDGRNIVPLPPSAVRDAGIETIYQDLALAENLDVGANVFLGKEKKKKLFGVLPVTDDEFMRAEAVKVLDRLDIHIPSLKQKLVYLSGGQRQAVAIARAIYWNARLVVMDEPTAALGVPEQRKVLSMVRTLRDQGVPIIFISHTMQDVMDVANRIVVMRRGRVVANMSRSAATVDMVVKYMVGAEDVKESLISP
jgi:ABC-type sugar transport system ATPase subunit